MSHLDDDSLSSGSGTLQVTGTLLWNWGKSGMATKSLTWGDDNYFQKNKHIWTLPGRWWDDGTFSRDSRLPSPLPLASERSRVQLLARPWAFTSGKLQAKTRVQHDSTTTTHQTPSNPFRSTGVPAGFPSSKSGTAVLQQPSGAWWGTKTGGSACSTSRRWFGDSWWKNSEGSAIDGMGQKQGPPVLQDLLHGAPKCS